jgi:hypothetical protein
MKPPPLRMTLFHPLEVSTRPLEGLTSAMEKMPSALEGSLATLERATRPLKEAAKPLGRATKPLEGTQNPAAKDFSQNATPAPFGLGHEPFPKVPAVPPKPEAESPHRGKMDSKHHSSSKYKKVSDGFDNLAKISIHSNRKGLFR